MINCTIIVNTYPRTSRSKDLTLCLNSLKKQVFFNFSVVIVENATNPAEVKKIINKCQLHQNITIICDVSKKLSHLFNIGWKAAQTEYIAFLADDAEAEPEWLKNSILLLDTDKKIGIVTGPVISICYPAGEMHRLYLISQNNWLFRLLSWPILYFVYENSILKPGYLCESMAYSLGTSLEEARHFKRQEIDLATTTSMAIKKQVLTKLNGFDETFNFNHADGDLFIRTKKNHYKIIFDPHIVVHHHVRLGPSRSPHYIGYDTALFLKRYLRPRTIRGTMGALLNVTIQNAYWLYATFRTRRLTQLKGIQGFIFGLIAHS